MRICFVCSEYPPGPHGGIGSSTRVLARALVALGHEVRIVGVYPRTYPAPNYEEDDGVMVWRLRRCRTRWGWIADRYRLYHRISAWAKQGDIDLVDVPDYQGWTAGWPRLPIPVITRLCGSASCIAAANGRQIERTTVRLEQASLRRADFQCAKSEFLATQTQNVFKLESPIQTILYNPIEIPGTLPAARRSGHRILFTGTLNTNKGIIPLVKAWPQVLDRHPDAELHVFGKDGRAPDGHSMQEFLLTQLDENQRKTVHFYGHLDRNVIFFHLVTARAAVFPSTFEGFANAPLEAMACGCPTIISTRMSPEIYGVINTLAVDPDSPSQIAAAILRFLEDDDFVQFCSEQGRKHVEANYTPAKIAEKNEEFYRRCLEEFQSRRPGRPAIERIPEPQTAFTGHPIKSY